MSVLCHSCNQSFEDFRELALHISSSKKGHRKGKRWAAKYIIGNRLNGKRTFDNGRVPLTNEQRINKEDTRRELSGELEVVNTICLLGKHPVRQSLPIEYSKSPDAWRIKGHLVVMCNNCKG